MWLSEIYFWASKLFWGALLAGLLLVLAIWTIAFAGFARHTERAWPLDPMPKADGIVVLTGGSLDRLVVGARLLERARGQRLLVSGVDRKVSRARLKKLLGVDDKLFKAKVDAGFDAQTTLGNAQEVQAWSRKYAFTRLIVVTDDYHMPRAVAEISAANPLLDLIAYPVRTGTAQPGRWTRDLTTTRRLAEEMTKYLLVQGREVLLAPATQAGSQTSAQASGHPSAGGKP